jgi:hypothetical protein
MGQMAVYCQNLTLGVLSSCITLSVLVGILFKKFGLFLNTRRIYGVVLCSCISLHCICVRQLESGFSIFAAVILP